MKKGLCWICGNQANSKEHKHKSSLIRKHFGKKYSENELSIFKEGVEHALNTYKDKNLVFSSKICEKCNNDLTKPADDSYDTMNRFIDSSSNYFRVRDNLDLRDVYGDSWENDFLELTKYFAKNIGCRIIDAEMEEEIQKLSDFILGKKPNTFLKVRFVFKEELVNFMNVDGKQVPNIFMGGMLRFGDTADDINYGTWYSYQGLSIYCIYTNRETSFDTINYSNPIKKIYKQKSGALAHHNNITLRQGCDIIEKYQHPTDIMFKDYCISIINENSH